MSKNFWSNKRVLVTGHTGFKGGWLSLWLTSMGAKVYGYSLAPEEKSFYHATHVDTVIAGEAFHNINNLSDLRSFFELAAPEIVFHLAAQSLVRPSYIDPIETFSTNIMGTVNVLDCAFKSNAKAVINVTSDKCYENREVSHAYNENDPMGGHDPYSASKGCSELVTASYRRSFYNSTNKFLASARAGNVVGGGDWSTDRLVPDFLRAWDEKQTLMIRSPEAIRPWQHVLEPLSGYIALAEKLYCSGNEFASGWNFGPSHHDTKTVKWVVEYLSLLAKGSSWAQSEGHNPHEAKLLSLDSTKSQNHLQWKPRWNVETALKKTVEWHLEWKKSGEMKSYSLKQIGEYCG